MTIAAETESETVATETDDRSIRHSVDELETDMNDVIESNSINSTNEPEVGRVVIDTRSNDIHMSTEAYNCTCFPNGLYVAIPAVLSTLGWFARLTQDGCDYSLLTGPTVGMSFA